MPAKSAKQYALMQAAAHLKSLGGPNLPPPSVAQEFIEKTPPKKRKQFARAIAKER